MHYPIVIHKEEGTAYGVIVPDIPGCFSAGESFNDALVQAQEAIACHAEGLLADGETLPIASDIEQHLTNPDYAHGIWATVPFDISTLSDTSKRINITVPERVLAMIDQAAKKVGETRSGYMATAALERATH